MKRWPDIFRTLGNACICRNLAYSKSWYIQNSSIIAPGLLFIALSYLWKLTNIHNSDIFKTRHIFRTFLKIQNCAFPKIVKNSNCFSKSLHLRSLTWFWIGLFLKKYLLICRATSCYVLSDTHSQSCLLS